ncbi:MAG: sulfotransferase [Pseudomonadales bacterium]
MSTLFEKPLFILGLPRSGTSMVAGMLKKSGFWCGTTVVGDRNNPKGYFEHVQIREKLVKEILREQGCDELGVRDAPDLAKLHTVHDIRRELKKILRDDGYRGNRPWLYKDAKLTLLWPLFAKAFPGASWLYVSRDLESFIDSCMRTRFMRQHSEDRDYWAGFAQRYLCRIDVLKASGENFLEIHAPDILACNYAMLGAVLENYGLPLDEKKLNRFVESRFWHASQGNPEAG